jgi:hypothetical protein
MYCLGFLFVKDCAKLADACDAGDGSCAKFAFPDGIADYCGFNDLSDLLPYLASLQFERSPHRVSTKRVPEEWRAIQEGD